MIRLAGLVQDGRNAGGRLKSDGEQGFGMGILKLLAGDAVVMGGRGRAADVTLADVWLLGGELEF